MRAILISALLFVSTQSFGSEERAREILNSMDCLLTEMGKGITSIRDLSKLVKLDIDILSDISSGKLSLSSQEFSEVKSRSPLYSRRNTKTVTDLSSGIERCGYTVAENSELFELLPLMSHDRDFLRKVEMLDSAVSFSMEEWDRLNEEFTARLNVSASIARGIARDIKARRR